MRISFGALSINQTARNLVLECLDKGRISGGTLVGRLELEMAARLGVLETVAVSSGTDADTLALAVLHDFGARRGDEVIVPALSYAATGHAVLHAGFKPVFVDIDPQTLNIDPELIEAAVSPHTRAVFPVHLMGKPAPMDEINAIAAKHDFAVIEDAAEAWGTEYKGRPAGALGAMGAFSLYAAHVISAGDGGVISTDREDYAEVLRSLRGHGRACACRVCVSNTGQGSCDRRFADKEIGDRRFYFQRVGYSSRMNELEAALGLGSLEDYDRTISLRRRNLLGMITGFERFAEYFQTFPEEAHETIGPHAFPFVLRPEAPFSRDELLRHLSAHGIDPRSLFASIPTQGGGYEFLGHRPGDFPHSEYVGRRGIHIGVHQDITPNDIEYFLEVIEGFLKVRL